MRNFSFSLQLFAKVIHGNSGNNHLNVNSNKTQAYGLAGDDIIECYEKSNVLLIGGSGNDTLTMSGGSGTLVGGVGNDIFNLNYSKDKKFSAVIEDIDPTNDEVIVAFDGDYTPQFSYTISNGDVVWNDSTGNFSLTLKCSSEARDYYDQDGNNNIWDILELVNSEREKVDLHPVVLSKNLSNASYIRAMEIVQNYAHTRPDGSRCFTAVTESYRSMGENIYSSPKSPEDAMTGWMNSQGHRENILRSSFNYIGVGYHYDASSKWKDHWVQMFGGKLVQADTISSSDILKTRASLNINGGTPGGNGNDGLLSATRSADGGNFYQYTGGNCHISDYASNTKVQFNTGFSGIGISGNDFQLHSPSGTLSIKNSRGKVIDVADANNKTVGYAYMANSPQAIDGRGYAAVEVIIGADNGSDIILAGNSGSSLWGGAGDNSDFMQGGNGADVFFYGTGDGADFIQNTNSLDQVIFYSPIEFQSIYMNGRDLVIQSSPNNKLTIENWSETAVNSFILWDGSKYSLQNANGTITAQRTG